MKRQHLISVVIPVYNEAQNIGPCLAGLWKALRDEAHELLVCYDFDEDTTLAAIKAMEDCPPTVRLVKNDLGKGVAYALAAGLKAAAGDVAVTTMSDLSDPPEKIPEMARLMRANGLAVVSGSRYMPGGSQEGGPWLKTRLSRLAGLSLHLVAGLPTHDATNNFRAYSGDFLDQVRVESTKGFEVGLELTVKARILGLGVGEVPSTWRDRSAGESRFRLFSSLPHYLRWYFLLLKNRPKELWSRIPRP